MFSPPALDDAVAIAKHAAEFWILPELYRLKAALLLRSSNDSNTLLSAEHLFETAMSQARKCGARSWELRAAMGYADAKRRRGDSLAGKQVLQPIFNEFSEGFAIRDLIDAQRLLHEL